MDDSTIYTFHITPSTPEARERIADGAEKPELLRGTLAQGRDLARLLNSSIDLLFGTGHTAFHVNPDGRMPCESEPNEASQSTMLVLYESVAAATISVVGLYVERSGGEVAQGATPGLWLERQQDGAHWPVMAAVHHSSYADLRVGDLFTVVLGTGAPPNVGDEVGLSTAPRPAEMVTDRRDLEPTTPLSAAAKDQLDHLAGEVRQQLNAGRMPNGNDLDRLARWAQQAARYGIESQDPTIPGSDISPPVLLTVAERLRAVVPLLRTHSLSANSGASKDLQDLLDAAATAIDCCGQQADQAADEVASWREWAAKNLAAYPWVDEFKPDDSDEKYRDGVRYVLLSIECDGSGSEADNQEMKAIRDRWGFS